MSKHYSSQKKTIARLVRELKHSDAWQHPGKERSRKQAIALGLKHRGRSERTIFRNEEDYPWDGMMFA